MLSIIICSIDDQKFDRISANYGRLLAREPHEIIRIADAAGLAEGYNRGASRSRGDVLVFSHDDIEILSDDFAGRLHGHLERADLLGVAGAARVCGGRWIAAGPPFLYGQVIQRNPNDGGLDLVMWDAPSRRVDGIRILDGLFLCAKRAVVEGVPFDQLTFDRFQLYDIDFTLRACLAGFRLAVCCDIWVMHHSYGTFGEQWEHYDRLFCQKHAAHIEPKLTQKWRLTAIRLESLDSIPLLMSPPHWRTVPRGG